MSDYGTGRYSFNYQYSSKFIPSKYKKKIISDFCCEILPSNSFHITNETELVKKINNPADIFNLNVNEENLGK